jgi:hypothetical protein
MELSKLVFPFNLIFVTHFCSTAMFELLVSLVNIVHNPELCNSTCFRSIFFFWKTNFIRKYGLFL